MKKLLIALNIVIWSFVGYQTTALAAAEEPKNKKVKVTKPCKDGQTEADGCHVVKKVEKAKPKPPAPSPKKNDAKK